MGIRAQETTKDKKPGLFKQGDRLGELRVVRLLGHGGMGEVYLARDTSLGRLVAVKVMGAWTDLNKERVESFLREARTTAQFNHPHIVTVHGAGNRKGLPYLIMEYLDGETLRQRMEGTRLVVAEACRLGLAAADALAEAHAHDVVHGDLKPENLLIPKDGRPRVVDFGLARVMSDPVDFEAAAREAEESGDPALDSTLAQLRVGGGRMAGTPPYMAPELWRGKGQDTPADIWALGVLLYELLSGRRPYEGTSVLMLACQVLATDKAPTLQVPNAPLPLQELVVRCLDKDPASRPTAAEARDILQRLVAGQGPQLTGEENPFCGLRPFSESQSALFFGRELELDAFMELLRTEPLLPVVGPSGAGKSSFVSAGVIPRLREQGAWEVIRLRPGDQPFQALATALAAADQSATERYGMITGDDADAPIEQRLVERPSLLPLFLERLSLRLGRRVLLFVDQLEELYTLCLDPPKRRRFVQTLALAGDDPGGPVRVILTLREDFLGRLDPGPGGMQTLGRVTVLRPPGKGALRQVVAAPLKVLGYAPEDDALLERMATDAGEGAAALPLVQFTAMLMWERRDARRKVITTAAYNDIGGVAGALAAHADEVLTTLDEQKRQVARSLLLRMVTPQGTRRVIRRQAALDELGPDAEKVLDRLVDARLITPRRERGKAGGHVVVELATESLIQAWGTLARWLEQGRGDVAFLLEAGQAADVWLRRGCKDEEVWQGDTLAEALRSLERCQQEVPEPVRRFLGAGRRIQMRRKWRVRVGVALAMVVLAAASALLLVLKQRADAQRDLARSNFAEAQREGAEAAEGRGDLLQARAELRGALQAEDTTAARALWMRLEQRPLIWRKALEGVGYSVAFSPDGRWLAAGGKDKSIHLLDTVTRRGRILRGIEDPIAALAFSPDGEHLAVSTEQGQVSMLELARPHSPAQILRQKPPAGAAIWALAFAPDGKLAWGDTDGKLEIRDPKTGDVRTLSRAGTRINSAAFTAGGSLLAAALSSGQVSIWNPATGRVQQTLGKKSDWALNGLAACPGGDILISGGSDTRVRIWSIRKKGDPRVLEGHDTSVIRVACSPRGELAASGDEGGVVRIWRIKDGRLLGKFSVAGASIYGLAFHPDGTSLATVGKDRFVRLWRVARLGQSRRPRGHTAPVPSVTFTSDGRKIVSGGQDGEIRFWEPVSGRQLRALPAGEGERLNAVAVSPDGDHLATAGKDGLVRLWMLHRNLQFRVKGTHWNAVKALAFAPDSSMLASAGTKYIRLWNVKGPTVELRLDAHKVRIFGLAFSPDRTRELIASCGDDGATRIWDLASKTQIWEAREQGARPSSVAFSPDGKHLAAGDQDGSVRLIDTVSLKHEVIHQGKGQAQDLAFAPDGELLGIPYSDGRIDLVHGTRGFVQSLRGHRGTANSVAFSPDGALLATSGDDGTVRTWQVETGRPAWRGPLLIPSPPTLLSHLGAYRLDSEGAASPVKPPVAWQQQVQEDARLASLAPDGKTVCMLTHQETLRRLSTSDSKVLMDTGPGQARQVLALDTGCVLLGAQQTSLIKGPDLSTRLHDAAHAVARAGKVLLLLDGQQVIRVGLDGKKLGTREVGSGATALAMINTRLVVGYANGHVGLGAAVGGALTPGRLEHTPASPVEALAAGPRGTLIIGYANGELGLWDLTSGKRLDHGRLHGPVIHLLVVKQKLYAASELGDHLVRDLSPLYREHCELLGDVWRRVPVIWSGGAAVARAPRKDHPCAN